MKHEPYHLRITPANVIAVDQGIKNGWFMSWNPDDNRFYVSKNRDASDARTFKEWRNAVRYARTH